MNTEEEESGLENKHSLHPEGWDGIFEALRADSDLPELVANFGVKYRLVEQLSSTAYEGDGPASDSYYIMTKMAIFFASVEAWEKITGKGSSTFSDAQLATDLRSPRWTGFFEKLSSTVSSENLKRKLASLQSGLSDDLLPLVEAVRHGFFHPRLTAASSGLAPNPELRKLLLRVVEVSRRELSQIFGVWAEETKRCAALYEGDDDDMHAAKKLSVLAGYPRTAIEQQFGSTLSEKQWGILVEEVFQEDEISVEEMISDVLQDMASFEAQYSSWEDQVAQAQAKIEGQEH